MIPYRRKPTPSLIQQALGKKSSPIWEGDLNDDCTARWAGLILRAEWMDGVAWWWAVSDEESEYEIDSSNNNEVRVTSPSEARRLAEKAACHYLRIPPNYSRI